MLRIIVELDAQKAIDVGIFVWIVDFFKVLETEQKKAVKEVEAESLSKISKMTVKLVCEIVDKELQRPPKNFKLVKIMQSIPSIDHVQKLILNRLLKNLGKDNAFKQEVENYAKNLYTVGFFITL